MPLFVVINIIIMIIIHNHYRQNVNLGLVSWSYSSFLEARQ